jgi:hypothetical protein
MLTIMVVRREGGPEPQMRVKKVFWAPDTAPLSILLIRVQLMGTATAAFTTTV